MKPFIYYFSLLFSNPFVNDDILNEANKSINEFFVAFSKKQQRIIAQKQQWYYDDIVLLLLSEFNKLNIGVEPSVISALLSLSTFNDGQYNKTNLSLVYAYAYMYSYIYKNMDDPKCKNKNFLMLKSNADALYKQLTYNLPHYDDLISEIKTISLNNYENTKYCFEFSKKLSEILSKFSSNYGGAIQPNVIQMIIVNNMIDYKNDSDCLNFSIKQSINSLICLISLFKKDFKKNN